MALTIRKIGWMATFLLAGGCSAQKPPAPGTFIPAISIVAANTKASGTVVPTPIGKHGRTSCPTGGWVTHGDDHKTRCPNCDPPWETAATPKCRCEADGGQCLCTTCDCNEPKKVNPKQVPVVDTVPKLQSYEDAVKAFDAMSDCPSGQCSPSTRTFSGGQYEQPSRRGLFGRRR